MRTLLVCIALLFAAGHLFGQTTDSTARVDSIVIPEPQTLDLQFLIAEALMNNPEIEASLRGMDVMDAKVPQAGALDDPELKFTSENMPGFDFNQAMFRRWELMQKIRFPSKLSAETELAAIRAEHAHHDHQEKVIEVLERLKLGYYELWYVQQNMVLTQENIRLMDQFAKIARTKYGVGLVPMQDVLKAQVELASLKNELTARRQQELSAKAMLMAILNRTPKDTLGFAMIPEEVEFTSTLDSLERLALNVRPMLIHDSLSVREGQAELSLAGKEYIPDFTIGIERVTSPVDGFSGWSVSAGITLPFAPWTLGKASARKDEASAEILKSQASYRASQAMVKASVRDHYYQVVAAKEQLDNYRTVILPQAEQSLTASRTAYQTGTTNFLMLIDAYRSLVMLTKEYFMTRMQFEQHVASLERAVGYQSLMATR
ncbi:MAG TPA: TolC family protein [Bacteroidota bacterium]|nr:TolC family protein [Bacteroidota bacterium]